MNNSSLARKGFQSKKNGQIFGPKMFDLPLYFRNDTPSTPIKHGSNGPAGEMRQKRQKIREKKRKNGGLKRK